MAIAANHKQIELLDPETNITYTLLLGEDDYKKATRDERFASALLNHAIANEENNTTNADEVNDSDDENIASTAINIQSNCISACSSNSKLSYMWKYDQVLALINSMENYMADLDDPKKRKDIYEHVANELLSMKYEVDAT